MSEASSMLTTHGRRVAHSVATGEGYLIADDPGRDVVYNEVCRICALRRQRRYVHAGMTSQDHFERARSARLSLVATKRQREAARKRVAFSRLTGVCLHRGCLEASVTKCGHCKAHADTSRDTRATYGRSRGPKTRKPHIGIEIECEFSGVNREHRLAGILKGLPRGKCDGSLTNGAEFTLCREFGKHVKPIQQICDGLTRAGATVSVRCGLHVHIDTRDVQNVRILRLRKWLKEHMEQWVFSAMSPSRRVSNFCTPINLASPSRYEWFNVTGDSTVEVRCHGGTLNPVKILSWCQFCWDLRELLLRDELPIPTGKRETGEPYGAEHWLHPISVEYLRSRAAHFQGVDSTCVE